MRNLLLFLLTYLASVSESFKGLARSQRGRIDECIGLGIEGLARSWTVEPRAHPSTLLMFIMPLLP